MQNYVGHDPILTIINNYIYHVREKVNARVLNSFNHNLDFGKLSEDLTIFSSVKSQFENHLVRHYVKPSSDGILFYTGEEIARTKKIEKGIFTKSEFEFPKKETQQRITCRCSSGVCSCPNCRSTKMVTCPNCSDRNGKCSSCRGQGEYRCSTCTSSGRCVLCSGMGRVTCSGCNNGYNYGMRTVTETSFTGTPYTYTKSERILHGSCNGTGQVSCNRCGGDGECNTCRGSGKITCVTCRGNGLCKSCSGHGALGCPTCFGRGAVTCPICEGHITLSLYSSDVYQYDYQVDATVTYPSLIDISKIELTPNFAGSLKLPNLEDSTIESGVGLLNQEMRKTSATANWQSQSLFTKGKDRAFSNPNPDFAKQQISTYSRLAQVLDDAWHSCL
jgi:hypothetical protein